MKGRDGGPACSTHPAPRSGGRPRDILSSPSTQRFSMSNLHVLMLLLREMTARGLGDISMDPASGRLSGDGWHVEMRTRGADGSLFFNDSDQHQSGLDGIVSDILNAAGYAVSRPNANLLLTRINGEFFRISCHGSAASASHSPLTAFGASERRRLLAQSSYTGRQVEISQTRAPAAARRSQATHS